MLLSAFLTDVSDRYPHTFTDAQVIRWLNNVIYRLYDDIAVDDTADVTTTEDLAIYDFPTGVRAENINAMTISLSASDADDLHYQRHLYPLNLHDKLKYNGWAKVDEETFIIYPTPSEDGQTIRIYYRPLPPAYTDSDTAKDIEDYIKKDYIEALTLGTIHTLCVNNEDIQAANNYALMYNTELQRIKRVARKRSGKFPTTTDVNKTPSKARRYLLSNRPRFYIESD